MEPAETFTIGQALTEFTLEGLDGRAQRLSQYPIDRARVLVFFSVECPTSRIYADHLVRLDSQYREKGVSLIAINSNFNEEAYEIQAFAEKQGFRFPVLRDVRNRLADLLDAQSTPHTYLFDDQGVLRYRGEIDNGFGKAQFTTSRGLWDAIDAVLDGQKVERPVTTSLGCTIRRVPPVIPPASEDTPTFTRDVLPFLQKNCQTCHHDGGIGRVAFLDYDQVAAWAPDMADSVRSGNMPPWRARDDVNRFVGQRVLQQSEKKMFYDWVAAGLPEGDSSDAPPPIDFPDGWALGEPDIVLVPDEAFTIEAVGSDEYRCFVMSLDHREDRYVAGIEVLPDAKEVVHHISVYLDESGKAMALQEADPGPGYGSFGGVGFPPSGTLGGWAPGNTPFLLPADVGRHLPAKCDIVMQVHYHKSGRKETDRSRLGIYLQKKPVRKLLVEQVVASRLLFIPPGVSDHRVSGSLIVDHDTHLLAILPHMHLLGQEIKVTANFPDGTQSPLVWVDRWAFNWQETYVYPEPVALPRGTHVNLEAVYDNSENNPSNPSRPPKFVRYGEKSTDEMCIAFLYVTRDDQNLLESSSKFQVPHSK